LREKGDKKKDCSFSRRTASSKLVGGVRGQGNSTMGALVEESRSAKGVRGVARSTGKVWSMSVVTMRALKVKTKEWREIGT